MQDGQCMCRALHKKTIVYACQNPAAGQQTAKGVRHNVAESPIQTSRNAVCSWCQPLSAGILHIFPRLARLCLQQITPVHCLDSELRRSLALCAPVESWTTIVRNRRS